MPNPLIQNNSLPIKELYKAITNSPNPQQMFIQIAKTNPQLQPIVKYLQQGISPQQIFNDICQQRGINPQEFIKQIQGNNT